MASNTDKVYLYKSKVDGMWILVLPYGPDEPYETGALALERLNELVTAE